MSESDEAGDGIPQAAAIFKGQLTNSPIKVGGISKKKLDKNLAKMAKIKNIHTLAHSAFPPPKICVAKKRPQPHVVKKKKR